MPDPRERRSDSQPWPTYPMIYRVSSAHEEGGDRVYAGSTQEFLGDEAGRVRALRLIEAEPSGRGFHPGPGTQRGPRCALALLPVGFTGPERGQPLPRLG